jgi:FMN phosphatase YigB (HAD superfamily)
VKKYQKLCTAGGKHETSRLDQKRDDVPAKPDPRIFMDACRAAGRKPWECWHVGDDLKADYWGSAAAGLKGVWLNRGNRKRIDGIPTIGSLLELKGMLGGTVVS